ncbi:MAG: glycosyltransferase family 9 protein [Chloroflexi bacterium]|nr:glycosyltransferase family 9 protein [Chloroflexota bacterium]
MIRRILALRAGALGDVILSLPAVEALRRRHPGATIEAWGYPDVWRVAGPLVDRVGSIDSPRLGGLYADRAGPELRATVREVDLAVAWTVRDPRAALADAGVPRVIWSSPYPPPGVHAADWLLRSLSPPARLPDGGRGWRLLLSAAEIAAARDLLERMNLDRPIVLHPGAGARWKRWPAERFAAVGEVLRRRGHQVVLVEGPADAEAMGAVQRAAPSPFPVVRGLSIRELAAVLGRAALFIGNDSGVTHLAGATGAPTLALFGPTDPAGWTPLGNARVLRACGAQAAHQGQIRVCEDPACLDAISVDMVMAAMKEYLSYQSQNRN